MVCQCLHATRFELHSVFRCRFELIPEKWRSSNIKLQIVQNRQELLTKVNDKMNQLSPNTPAEPEIKISTQRQFRFRFYIF